MLDINELPRHILELQKIGMPDEKRRRALEIFIRTFGSEKQIKLLLKD